MVLGVAAVLKGWLVLTDSFADLRTGYPITILYLAIVFELVAAAWLIFGRDATIKWLILAVAISLFLFVSLIRYSIGITGCGCLGSVELPRWLLPLNSALVLAGLVVFACHPRSRTLFRFREITQDLRKKLSNPTTVGGLVCLVLIVSGLAFFPWVQDYPIVTSFLGESPMPVVKYSAGDLSVDESADLVIPWRNGTSAKVVFLGSQTSCTCVGLTNSQLSADPQEQVELKVNVRPRKPGLFHQRIVCFVDHPQQDRLTLDVIANAVIPPKEN
jgi:hypothetical protein